MADTAARLALRVRRYEVARFTITVRGIDMTGVAMAMQVRLQRGTPGAPLIALATVTTAAAEGLKLDSVRVVDGVPVSIITGRINQSTMSDGEKVPYAGEMGDDTILAYAMQWTLNGDARTRIEGDLIVSDSAFGSDNAPANRPVGYGSQSVAGGDSGTLTFGDQVIAVTVNGIDLLSPVLAEVSAAGDRADAAAAQAERALANLAPAIQALVGGGFLDPTGILGEPSLYLTRRYYAQRGSQVIDLNPAANPESDREGYVRLPLGDQSVVQLLIVDPATSAYSLVAFADGGFALPAGSAVVASLWNGKITTTLPIRDVADGLRRNQFAGGKTMDSPALLTFGPVSRGPLADGPLKAAGFTGGIQGQINDDVYVGARFPDPYTKGSRVVITFRAQSTIDDQFGQGSVYLWRDDAGGPSGTAPMTVQQVLGPRERIYRVEFINTLDRLDYFYVGRFTQTTGAAVMITGLQFHASKEGASEIRPDDFPMSVEGEAAPDPMQFAVPETLWMAADRALPFYVDNLCGAGNGDSLVATIDGNEGAPRFLTGLRSGDPIIVDPAIISAAATLTLRNARPPFNIWRKTMSVKKAPVTAAKTARHLQFGDSLTKRDIPSQVVDILRARGMTATGIGTIQSGATMAEGREGKQWGEYIYQLTSLPPVTDVAAYQALNQFQKMEYNPWIRQATGSDPADLVFNGYIFDFLWGLERLGLAAPTHVTIALGTNDITFSPGSALAQVNAGARVMITQILKLANVRVSLLQHTVARTAEGDARLPAHNAVQRALIKQVRDLASDRVAFIPAYAHQSRDTGWPVAATATAADTGLQAVTITDTIHFADPNKYVAAELVANWIMATAS